MSQTPEDVLIEESFHEIFGVAADAAVSRREGGELSLWLRGAQKRVLENLRKLVTKARLLGPAKQLTEEVKPIKPAAAPATVPMRNGKTG